MPTSVVKEISELKNQISYAKNVGFFFGAGTSCALKIPNITQLTSEVNKRLKDDNKNNFEKIVKDLETIITDRKVNIEDILNQVRRIREITNDREDRTFVSVSGKAAKALDHEICVFIYAILDESEAKADIKNTRRFFSWLNMLNREFPRRCLLQITI